MHIIIIANHQPATLAPLVNDGSIAMLSIGGKSLIEHMLENVTNVTHSHMTIIGSRGFNSMRQLLGTGARWGLELDFISSRPNEALVSLKRRHPKLFEGTVMVLTADRVFLEPLSEQSAVKQLLDTSSQSSANEGMVRVLEPAYVISNHKEYLDANLAAARGSLPQLQMRGTNRSTLCSSGPNTRWQSLPGRQKCRANRYCGA